MRTLIFNGSPHTKGDTAALLCALRSELQGDVHEVSAYTCNIRPCNDCRACWQEPKCIIHDTMQDVYRYLETCNNVIIASPLYFSELTGPLLSVLSRLQMLWIKRNVHKIPASPIAKYGALLLVGGGDGGPKHAIATGTTLLRQMGCSSIDIAQSLRTNSIPASKDANALASAADIGRSMNAIRELCNEV